MNALEKVVDLLSSVVLLFLIPLLFYGSGTRVSQAILVGQTGENFLKRISTAGEITLPVWREFEDALTRYGCSEFELQRERRLYEPIGENGAVEVRTYIEEKEALTEQVMKEGRSRLQKGDKIRLILYLNESPTVYYDYVRTGAGTQ